MLRIFGLKSQALIPVMAWHPNVKCTHKNKSRENLYKNKTIEFTENEFANAVLQNGGH